MNYIDLSVPINNKTPVYPGDPKHKITQAEVLKTDGYQDHTIYMGNHLATHIDAPSHMLPKAKNLDEFPIDKFIGKGVYIKMEDKIDLIKIKDIDIQQGDIVLFHTGMSDCYHKPAYFESYPVISPEIVRYLIERKIKMVGFDTCSADNEKSFPIHKILLGAEILIIENLTNLYQLKGKDFKVFALPINLQLDGSPARVVAELLA